MASFNNCRGAGSTPACSIPSEYCMNPFLSLNATYFLPTVGWGAVTNF